MTEYIKTIALGSSNKSISIEEYQGKFSIVSTWETRDGAIKPNWVFRKDRVDGENVPGKAIPLKLQVGDNKTQAVSVLTQLLNSLGASAVTTGPEPKPASKPEQSQQRPGPVDRTMTRRTAYQTEEDIPF